MLDGVIFTPCDPIRDIQIFDPYVNKGDWIWVSWKGANGESIAIYLISGTKNITLESDFLVSSEDQTYGFEIPTTVEFGSARILLMQKDLPLNSFYSPQIEIERDQSWIPYLVIGAIAIGAIAGLVIIKNKQKESRNEPSFLPIGTTTTPSSDPNKQGIISSLVRSVASRDMNMPKSLSVRYTKTVKELEGKRVQAISVRYTNNEE